MTKKTTIDLISVISTSSADVDLMVDYATMLFAKPSRAATAYGCLLAANAKNGVTLGDLAIAYNVTGGKGRAGMADLGYVASWYVPSWLGKKLPGLQVDKIAHKSGDKAKLKYYVTCPDKVRKLARQYLFMTHGARGAQAIGNLDNVTA